ncbi:MAG: tail fiber domain-containing protein [Spirochaetota bacterium]
MLNWFKKESKVLRKKITTRVLVIALAIIAFAVSGTVLMAGWLDDNPTTPGQVINTDPPTGNVSEKNTLYAKTLRTYGSGVLWLSKRDSQSGGGIIWEGADTYQGWTQEVVQNCLRFFSHDNTNADNFIIYSNGNVRTKGVHTSQSYACSSDVRYKKDVSTYSNALEKVLGLRGVSYFWKTDEYKDKNFSKDKQLGFIAQEVEKVIPELVYTDDKGFKTMSYDRLTAVLVEAVKELKAQSDAKISVLSKENAELKQRLAKLDAVVADRLAKLEKAVEKQQLAQK